METVGNSLTPYLHTIRIPGIDKPVQFASQSNLFGEISSIIQISRVLLTWTKIKFELLPWLR